MNEVTKAQGYISDRQIADLAASGIIPQGTPRAQLAVFIETARQHELSPFKKEIYLLCYRTKQGPVYSCIVGIDGFRNKAGRTGQHAGTDDCRYNLQSDGAYETAAQVKSSGKMPVSATVTVWKIVSGIKCGFTTTVLFTEYYPAGGFGKHQTMPFNMIAKCAEAKALKMAFGGELGGLHIEEEAAAFQDVTIEATLGEGIKAINELDLQAKILAAGTIEELHALYVSDKGHSDYSHLFTERKAELLTDATSDDQ